MGKHKFSELDKEYILTELSKCKSIKEFCDNIKCSFKTAKTILKKHNIDHTKYVKFNNYHNSLINTKINELKILSIKIHNDNRKYCTCLCDCGNIKEFRIDSIISGKINKCCSRKNKNRGKDHCSYKGIEDLSSSYFTHLKNSAKYRNIEFNLTIEFLWNLYLKQGKKCNLSGIDLLFPKGSVWKTGNISLDRIDSKIGYIESNVQWVDKDVNMMKNVLSNERLIEICQKISKKNQ